MKTIEIPRNISRITDSMNSIWETQTVEIIVRDRGNASELIAVTDYAILMHELNERHDEGLYCKISDTEIARLSSDNFRFLKKDPMKFVDTIIAKIENEKQYSVDLGDACWHGLFLQDIQEADKYLRCNLEISMKSNQCSIFCSCINIDKIIDRDIFTVISLAYMKVIAMLGRTKMKKILHNRVPANVFDDEYGTRLIIASMV